MKYNGGGSPRVNWFQKQMTVNILHKPIVMFGSSF
jgi:hypothetical protein